DGGAEDREDAHGEGERRGELVAHLDERGGGGRLGGDVDRGEDERFLAQDRTDVERGRGAADREIDDGGGGEGKRLVGGEGAVVAERRGRGGDERRPDGAEPWRARLQGETGIERRCRRGAGVGRAGGGVEAGRVERVDGAAGAGRLRRAVVGGEALGGER